jgi:hypothetical protein
MVHRYKKCDKIRRQNPTSTENKKRVKKMAWVSHDWQKTKMSKQKTGKIDPRKENASQPTLLSKSLKKRYNKAQEKKTEHPSR